MDRGRGLLCTLVLGCAVLGTPAGAAPVDIAQAALTFELTLQYAVVIPGGAKVAKLRITTKDIVALLELPGKPRLFAIRELPTPDGELLASSIIYRQANGNFGGTVDFGDALDLDDGLEETVNGFKLGEAGELSLRQLEMHGVTVSFGDIDADGEPGMEGVLFALLSRSSKQKATAADPLLSLERKEQVTGSLTFTPITKNVVEAPIAGVVTGTISGGVEKIVTDIP